MNPRFTVGEASIDELLLDLENPRIPEECKDFTQEQLLAFVAENYNALTVAKSIARHSYFPSEPLIVLREGDNKIVVEGNRRLSALKLLAHPELRDYLDERREWDSIELHETAPLTVPVIYVDSRREVAPIIGYRHISGIQPWDPYAKARYIAAQKDSGLTFEQVATEVGEKENDIKASYRNFRIIQQAISSGIETEDAVAEFGVFTKAMQTKGIRDFVGVPTAKEVGEEDPVSAENLPKLGEFMGLVFGDDAVVDDSRQLSQLGQILSSASGLQTLRDTRDIEQADAASGGPLERLITRLNSAVTNLRAARVDIQEFKEDDRVEMLLDECEEALSHLQND